ncbi:HAD family hydrolase [Micromonospora sp. CA-240977]|uniref:HAD family hydrolase n=1 Tax=Micromonospora sp. CA-240977 TaxID=3239957 RepID=UPI003D8A39A3
MLRICDDLPVDLLFVLGCPPLDEIHRVGVEVSQLYRVFERAVEDGSFAGNGVSGGWSIVQPGCVEDALCAAERRAVETAEPTPYGREVIVAAQEAGMPVAVVSNNSPGAVFAYLAAHRLAGHISPVVGRAYADPDRMKPNPEPILQAARVLGEQAGRCVLVGDSLSDIEGARAAGVRTVGYANRPTKVGLFRDAGADVVITGMGALAHVLLKRRVGDNT